MPPHPRHHVVREGEIAIYHTWSRCVQRAFLCGRDPLTGLDYNYRRGGRAGELGRCGTHQL